MAWGELLILEFERAEHSVDIAHLNTVTSDFASSIEEIAFVPVTLKGARSDRVMLDHAMRLKVVHGQLLTFVAAGENYINGLARHPHELLAVNWAAGAAIVVDERCILLGEVLQLVE